MKMWTPTQILVPDTNQKNPVVKKKNHTTTRLWSLYLNVDPPPDYCNLLKKCFDSSADSRKSDFDFEKQIILFRIWQLKIAFLAISNKIMQIERMFL